MQTFLIVVGAIVVGVPLAVLIALVVMKLYLKHLFKGLGKEFGGLMEALKGLTTQTEQARISMVRADDALPPAKARTEWFRWTEGLKEQGFSPAGVYTVDEIPDLIVAGYADEARRAYGAVCALGERVFTDIVAETEDGKHVCYGSLEAQGVDRPPWTVAVNMPGCTPEQLVTAFTNGRPAGSLPVSVASFQQIFEDAHARTMDWRLARGVSHEEVERVAKKDPSVTQEQIAMTAGIMQGQYEMMIEQAIRHDLRKARGTPKADWAAMEDRMFVVRESTTPSDAADALQALHHDDDTARAKLVVRLSEGPIREAVERVVAEAGAAAGYSKLGSVTRPVHADLYLGPEPPDDGSDDEDADDEDLDDEFADVLPAKRLPPAR